MSVFIGILRSGTMEAVRAALLGIDVSLSDEIGVLEPTPIVAPPTVTPPMPSGTPAGTFTGPQQIGDVTLVWANGVPLRAVQNSNPTRRADVPSAFWAAVEATFPAEIWPEIVALAFLESDYVEAAHNPSPLEDSWGALQVNRKAWPNYSQESLVTFAGNVAAAWDIYKLQGWPAWQNSAHALGLV